MRNSIVLGITAALASISSSAPVQSPVSNFAVYTMQVLDMRIPYTMHNVSFTINAPNATKEEGGDDYGLCSFGWFDGGSPTCWTQCKSQPSNTSASNPDSTYYARLDAYSSADQFNISVWQAYPEHHNTGLVSIVDGKDGYYCSHGAQTTQCSIGFPFTPIQVPIDCGNDGCEPTDWPVC